MKIYLPQPIAREGMDYLIERGYQIKPGTGTSVTTMKEEIQDCDAVLLRTTPCPKEVLVAGNKLKIVARHGVGFDNIDVGAAEELGIWVTNTPEALSDSVAEYTLAALLMALKNIPDCSQAMYNQDYRYKDSHRGFDVSGKTLAIFGFGRIGRAVAQKAHFGLGMEIVAYHPTLTREEVPEYVQLTNKAEAIAQADVLSLHLPYTASTKNFIDEAEFLLMKETAVLVNVARGGVVNEMALDTALKEGQLYKAVLDVQSQEPPKQDYPLFKNENVILTPHMASNTYECMNRLALHAAMEIDRVLRGKTPKWPVNQPFQRLDVPCKKEQGNNACKQLDGEKLWQEIEKALMRQPLEIQTLGKGLWFRASFEENRLLVEKARTHLPTCELSKARMISKQDFLLVYSYYEDWSAGISGIREEITQKSRNTAYLFALIAYFL